MISLRVMRKARWARVGSAGLAVLLAGGCGTVGRREVPIRPAVQATREVPEEQLLDVGIVAFDPGVVTEKVEERDGTDARIRGAEAHFIPHHLKNTLQQTGHWGAVRVLPAPIDHADLLVTGKILESDGKKLSVEVTACDGAGGQWLRKTYTLTAEDMLYGGTETGQRDVFQPVYNEIANDLLQALQALPPEGRRIIRTTAQLRFAADFAPEPYAEYIEVDDRDRIALVRLPAEDDPLMERLQEVREREHMYVDTLDEYYERLYQKMWPEYENWRKFNYAEQKALAEVHKQKWTRVVGGVLMIALAVALEVSEVENTGTLRDVLVLGGGSVVVSGINVSQQAAMHKAALDELSESFGSEMEPVVIELEGKQIELTGTAQEQFAQWRQILRERYRAETGFEPDPEI